MNHAQECAPRRGRPKSLDREQVLNIAMASYWQDGVSVVSVNEICKRADVSKPGLYREFINEDGLQSAALAAYYDKLLVYVDEFTSPNLSFAEGLEALIGILGADRTKQSMPRGCLFVNMRQNANQLGKRTAGLVEKIEQDQLRIYREWFERNQSEGGYVGDLSPELAAKYLHAQINSAMDMQFQNHPSEDIAAIMRKAFEGLNEAKSTG